MILNRMLLIKLWFIADAVLALFPPLYWWVNGQPAMLGLPATLVYFLLVSICITASVVAAYYLDSDGSAAR
ncbi:hypothetical protein ACW4YW_12860 [Methylobacillus pratensis]